MGSEFKWNAKLKLAVPGALLRGHNEARAELVRATMEGGGISKAAKRVAELCLPHFEHEEQSVFPVLALLPDLEQGNLRPEMMDVMPLISDFRAKHNAVSGHHRSILAAIETLLLAANKAKYREIAELAYNLRIHESIEDEVVYPAVSLIGYYLHEKFGD